MGPSWRIGSAFGIGLFVHWSFLLLPLWTFGLVASDSGVENGLYAAVLVLTMFGCVVLHELGHALTARYFGIGTRDITLYPIGGVARLEQIPERAVEELWVIVAGPSVNVVIAALLIPTGLMASWMSGEFTGVPRFVLDLGVLNLWLAIFNMVPVFPMDGGRVFRAVLQFWLGRLMATEIAAMVGLSLGAVLFLGGFFLAIQGTLQGCILVILASFVMFMGQQELRATRRRAEELRGAALQVLPADDHVIDIGELPARPNFSGFTWDRHHGIWIEWREGQPVHTIQIQSQ
jgi:Zn-dependent protease